MMKTIKLGFVVILAFAVTGIAYEASAKKEATAPAETVVASDQIQGTVSAIGKNYISVIYDYDSDLGVEYEMRLPLDENVTFKNKKDVTEFKVGDVIQVSFDDLTETTTEGSKAKRKAKAVTFVKAAPTEDSTLVSDTPSTGKAKKQ